MVRVYWYKGILPPNVEMPSVKRSNYWFVRVDGSKEELKDSCIKFAEQIDLKRMLVVHHVGSAQENPHCHFIAQMDGRTNPEGLQKQSFDKRLKAFFEKYNRDYSSKIWDGQLPGAGSYLFHEDGDVLFNKGFSEEEIQVCKDHNKKVQEIKQKAKALGPGAAVERAVERLRDKLQRQSNMSYEQKQFYVYCLFKEEVKKGELHEQASYKWKQMVEEVIVKCMDSEMKWNEYLRDSFQNIFVKS